MPLGRARARDGTRCALLPGLRLERLRGGRGAADALGVLVAAGEQDQREDARQDPAEAEDQARGRTTAQTADTSSSSRTWKDEPQPQAAITLGFSTLKPAPWRPST